MVALSGPVRRWVMVAVSVTGCRLRKSSARWASAGGSARSRVPWHSQKHRRRGRGGAQNGLEKRTRQTQAPGHAARVVQHPLVGQKTDRSHPPTHVLREHHPTPARQTSRGRETPCADSSRGRHPRGSARPAHGFPGTGRRNVGVAAVARRTGPRNGHDRPRRPATPHGPHSTRSWAKKQTDPIHPCSP